MLKRWIFRNLLRYDLFYKFARPYLGWGVLAATITSLTGGMDAAIAWVLRPLTDTVLLQNQPGHLAYAPLIIVAFTLCQGVGKHASNYLSVWVSSRVIMDIKAHMFEKLLRRGTAFFDTTTSGMVLASYNHDVDAACHGIFGNGKTLVMQLASTVSLTIVLFYNSWILASVALLFLLLAVYPVTQLRNRLRNLQLQNFVIGTNLLTCYNETHSGNRVITSYNLYAPLMGKLRSIMTGQYDLSLRILRRAGRVSVFMHLMIALGIALTIWLQGYLITTQSVTPGNLVSFIAALLLLYRPVKNLGNNFQNIMHAQMAVDRLTDNLRREPLIKDNPDATEMRPFHSRICYENVRFSYQPGSEILKGINLTIRKGETIALVGESGSGKTTMANLLPRFYDATSGKITVDGVDIRALRVESLRGAVAMVFQDNFLFDGTIRENILVGKPGASQEETEAAVDAACLRGFITSLPAGLETHIGERGILLSGGEKQRVAIARAFIKNSPIVILDEATSSLDNNSEAIVQQAIDNLESDKTVVIIAHRLSSVVKADRILVFDHGEIVETGTHDELLAIPDGAYAKLYALQLAL